VNKGKRGIVGLRGGLDSSVTENLLKQQGYEVTGVTMALWNGDYACTGKQHACYRPDEIGLPGSKYFMDLLSGRSASIRLEHMLVGRYDNFVYHIIHLFHIFA